LLQKLRPLNFWVRPADIRKMNHHRRKKKRNLCSALLMISWIEDGGHRRTEMAALEDISVTGACLHLENSIPAGTSVCLHYPKGKYQGKVKYCKRQEIGFLMGISFDQGHPWSRLEFQPSRLLERQPA